MSYGLLHRWTASSRSVVIPETSHRRVFGQTDIAPGWRVLDLDDVPIGTVSGEDSGWLKVSRGFFRRPVYVPTTEIHEVGEGWVRLAVHVAEIDEKIWTKPPGALHDRDK